MRILAMLIFSLASSAASACSIVLPADWVDQPIVVERDGSFVNAGWEFGDEMSGLGVVDLGDGRVGQRLIFEYCFEYQRLLVADCRTRDAIMITGIRDVRKPPLGTGHQGSIDLIQVPVGPIDVRALESLDEIAALADANGYHYLRDLDSFAERMKVQNRFDPYNGCKIFYPNSSGATL